MTTETLDEVETNAAVPTDAQAIVVSQAHVDDVLGTDIETRMAQADTVVAALAKRCQGSAFISPIQGKQYPRVEWWTTMGAAIGVFPREVESKRLPRDDGAIVYEATVEVHHNGNALTRATAICSSQERRWGTADEYAIKSMATTRAIGRAFRIPFAFLATMSGLQPTPAEEMTGVVDNAGASAPAGDPAQPAKGKVVTVHKRHGESAKGPWTKFGVELDTGHTFGTFREALVADAKPGTQVLIRWKKSDYGYDLEHLEAMPDPETPF